MMYWQQGGWTAGNLVLFGMVMLVFWGLVVFAVIAAVRAIARSSRAAGGPPEVRSDASRILDERFARGEIDADDYSRRRAALRGA